jgi:pimeloyl-[acyl-carrier protein] methyl ester esterase
MDGTGSLLSDFIASLPRGIESVVVTYPTDTPLGYRELEALVSQKLPSEPFILLGESFSGPIAIALAASGPVGLQGVILVGSFARRPVPAPVIVARVPFWKVSTRIAAAVLLGRWSSKDLRSRLSTATASVHPAVWRTRLHAVLSVDVVASLRMVSVPVLYLRGRSDRVVPRSAWSVIKDALPAARLVELDGPHFLLQAKPTESAAQVAEFAKAVGLPP